MIVEKRCHLNIFPTALHSRFCKTKCNKMWLLIYTKTIKTAIPSNTEKLTFASHEKYPFFIEMAGSPGTRGRFGFKFRSSAKNSSSRRCNETFAFAICQNRRSLRNNLISLTKAISYFTKTNNETLFTI